MSWEGGEGCEVEAGAVDYDGVGREGVLGHSEVIELAGAGGVAGGEDEGGVELHHGVEGSNLAGVLYLTGQAARLDLVLHWPGQTEAPPVQPGERGQALPGIVGQVHHLQPWGEALQHLRGHCQQLVVGQVKLSQLRKAGE